MTSIDPSRQVYSEGYRYTNPPDRAGRRSEQNQCENCYSTGGVTMYSSKLDLRLCPYCWPKEWDFPHEQQMNLYRV